MLALRQIKYATFSNECEDWFAQTVLDVATIKEIDLGRTVILENTNNFYNEVYSYSMKAPSVGFTVNDAAEIISNYIWEDMLPPLPRTIKYY